MIEETKSNWLSATELMQEQKPIALGRYASYWVHHSPRRMLHCLSYYKFAAKLIGKSKRVLDVGCNEGLGTYLLGKECGFAKGVDFDEEAILTAQNNFSDDCVSFSTNDILNFPQEEIYDAVVHFDVIEHIYPKHVHSFWEATLQRVSPEGLVILGTPSEISQTFASEISRRGHVNIYSPQRLEEEMSRYFEHVFLFAANDELVHTGYLPLAHYLIAVGCKKKINLS